MSELNTLRISSSSRCIAKEWIVIFSTSLEWLMWLRLTSFNNKAIVVNLNTNLLALLNLFRACLVKTHQILDWLCKFFFFHTDYFRNVLLGRKDTWQLSLVNDKINSFNTHGIKKSNSCLFVVHVSYMSRQPFPSIFCPNTNEFPTLTITFCLCH